MLSRQNPMAMKKRAPNRVPFLVNASREAALNAIQNYNNPLMMFKSESFIINMNVAWTYLLHAAYLKRRVEIRYLVRGSKARRFEKTTGGDYRYWNLNRCVNACECPLESDVKHNIRLMIGLRNEVVHKGSTELDDALAPMFLSNCLNFEAAIVDQFGQRCSLEPHLRFALQFRDLVHPHHLEVKPLPSNVAAYITQFETKLPTTTLNSPRYAYRVYMQRRMANSPGQADRVIEFVDEDSELALELDHTAVVIKERERPKSLPKSIVDAMRIEGFPSFNMHEHTRLWKALDAKNPTRRFGVSVAGSWYWYEEWINVVRVHCETNAYLFRKPKMSTEDRQAVVFSDIQRL